MVRTMPKRDKSTDFRWIRLIPSARENEFKM